MNTGMVLGFRNDGVIDGVSIALEFHLNLEFPLKGDLVPCVCDTRFGCWTLS